MSNRKLTETLKQLADNSSYLNLIISEEEYYLRYLYRQLLTIFGDPRKDTFAAEKIIASERTAAEILESIQTQPLLASDKVIYLFALEQLAVAELAKLEEVLLKQSEVVKIFIFMNKLDKRKKFFQKLLKSAAVYQFAAVDRRTIAEFAQLFAKERGKKISRKAVEHLQEVLSGNLMLLESEIEKLSLAADKKAEIDLALAESLVGGTHLENIFAIGEELGNKDARAAFVLLNKILARGDEGVVINGLLARHFRALRLARYAKSTLAAKNSLQEVFKISPYFVDRYLGQAKSFAKQELDMALKLFYQNDRRLKSGEEAATIFSETIARLSA